VRIINGGFEMKNKTKLKILNCFTFIFITSFFTSLVWICNPNDFQVNLNVSPLLFMWGLVFSFVVVRE